MSDNSGPYFTSDGRPYYIVNGQTVWGSSGRANHGSTSSSRAAAATVVSKYDSSQPRRTPSRHGSFPPTASPSATKQRMMTGYPNTRFDASGSQGSAPAYGHEAYDPYRDALDRDKNPTGPPLSSSFVKQYNQYKDWDAQAAASEDEYKRYLHSAPRVTTKMRRAEPEKYAGNPPATQAWHQSAAKYAGYARDAYRKAADTRDGMGRDYVGYDTAIDAKGHRDRIEKLESGYTYHSGKYGQHSNSHGNKR